MGRPKLFAINLSGNNSVYFAGSNVEGSVVLEISEPKKAQGIIVSIVFSGKAYVHWTESRSSGVDKTNVQKLFTILVLKFCYYYYYY